jgi:RNA ligase (TIGR02306 family)
MDITYERNVAHCERSPYVKEVTIDECGPAMNSDFLDRITFKEMGWNAIAQKGLHESGKRVFFLPADSVLPLELSDALGVTQYLSKGRVRVTRLRGNRSEGLIVDREKAEPYLPYILKWEDPPTVAMRGDGRASKEVPIDFERFYKIPNLLNEPETFSDGERIVFSEKIHGTNVRCGILKHPETDEYELYVGSHNIVLKEGDNVYWRMVKTIADRLPQDYVFYGEVYGLGIQHLAYDLKTQAIMFFAASKNGKYMLPGPFKRLCDEHKLPRVLMHPTVYAGLESARALADLESEYSKSHHREGIVIVSAEKPRRMAKVIGFEYLTSKDKKRTERH